MYVCIYALSVGVLCTCVFINESGLDLLDTYLA